MEFYDKKGWNWLKIPSMIMQSDDSSHIITTIQDDDQEIESEPTQSQEVMISIKSKTQPIRLNDYEMFLDQAI